mmetsp:Transcript_17761/g.38879  ORF Transcript_17761/g.38879 Transcript_17761/m.38879 type:complete len:231 (-) Transcript_17761:928-1620(-)
MRRWIWRGQLVFVTVKADVLSWSSRRQLAPHHCFRRILSTSTNTIIFSKSYRCHYRKQCSVPLVLFTKLTITADAIDACTIFCVDYQLLHATVVIEFRCSKTATNLLLLPLVTSTLLFEVFLVHCVGLALNAIRKDPLWAKYTKRLLRPCRVCSIYMLSPRSIGRRGCRYSMPIPLALRSHVDLISIIVVENGWPLSLLSIHSVAFVIVVGVIIITRVSVCPPTNDNYGK